MDAKKKILQTNNKKYSRILPSRNTTILRIGDVTAKQAALKQPYIGALKKNYGQTLLNLVPVLLAGLPMKSML